MLLLLADLTDPAWGKTILDFLNGFGLGGLTFVVALYAAYKFGGRILDRLEKFLDAQQQLNKENADNLKAQKTFCEQVHAVGGVANIKGVTDAGHAFAEMGRKIGEKVGVDVSQQAEKVHDALRGGPA